MLWAALNPAERLGVCTTGLRWLVRRWKGKVQERTIATRELQTLLHLACMKIDGAAQSMQVALIFYLKRWTKTLCPLITQRFGDGKIHVTEIAGSKLRKGGNVVLSQPLIGTCPILP